MSQTELNERVQRWGMRPEVVEKDCVIGWVLWGIGSDPDLNDWWAFKGGTCLKKCYLGDYRFSEDLDFTSLPGGTAAAPAVLTVLTRMLQRVSDESGIDFQSREPRFAMRDNGTSAEGRIYYRGPRGAHEVSRIKLDVTTTDAERVVCPTVWLPVSHEYSDDLPEQVSVRCYSLEEIFAEKVRVLGDRCLLRDLYDVVNLFRRREYVIHSNRVANCTWRNVTAEVCQYLSWPTWSDRICERSPPADGAVGTVGLDMCISRSWRHSSWRFSNLLAMGVLQFFVRRGICNPGLSHMKN